MIFVDRLHGNCLGLDLHSLRLIKRSLRDFWELGVFEHLLLQLLPQLLGLALFVVVHNHHGRIDLPNGHVAG